MRPEPTYFVSQLRAGKWRTVLTTKDAAKAYELLARLGAKGQLEVHPAHPPKLPSGVRYDLLTLAAIVALVASAIVDAYLLAGVAGLLE